MIHDTCTTYRYLQHISCCGCLSVPWEVSHVFVHTQYTHIHMYLFLHRASCSIFTCTCTCTLYMYMYPSGKGLSAHSKPCVAWQQVYLCMCIWQRSTEVTPSCSTLLISRLLRSFSSLPPSLPQPMVRVIPQASSYCCLGWVGCSSL